MHLKIKRRKDFKKVKRNIHYYNSINKDNYALINMDKKKIKRILVSCAVECKGSIEDI